MSNRSLRRSKSLGVILVSATLLQAAFGQAKPTPPQTQALPVIPKTPDVILPPSLILPPPAEVEVGSKPLSLHEAIAIALRKQFQVVAAQGSLLSAQGSTEQAASGLLPQVAITGGYNAQGAVPGVNPGFGGGSQSLFNVGVNATQLLFDFGRTRDLVRQRQALETSSEQTLNATSQGVALQVKLDFYTLIQGRANAALSEADVANRRRQLDEASARVTSGIGPPSDLVQAKTNLADATIALVDARETALLNQITLAQDMGVDPLTPINADSSTESNLDGEGNLRSLVRVALRDRPDVRAAQKQVAAASYGVSFARKGNRPSVLLSVGATGQDSSDPFRSPSGFVGVNLSWPMVDGGATAGAVKQARGSQENAAANLTQITQQAVTAVGNAYLDLAAAQQRATLARVEVANANELVRISEGRYDGGQGLFLDITNAQNSLVAAQRNLTQAEADAQRARARLRNAVGLLE